MRTLLLAVRAALTAACSTTPDEPPPARSVLGVWHMESDLQGRTIPANLILEKDELGTFSGVWESMGQEMDLGAISYTDGVLRFERAMGRGGATLAFEGQVVDGALQGVQRGEQMEIPCVGSRFRLDRDGPAEAAPSRGDADSPEAYLAELEADYERHAARAVPRDSFEVLDNPSLVRGVDAATLTEDEFVLGVFLDGEARAYPIGALGSSELLNDVCGETPIAASW